MFRYRNQRYKLDIVFPNKEYGGVYSLGPLIVYNLVNNCEDWFCERVFLDSGKINGDLVGFSLQYEGDFRNVLMMKPSGKICFAGGPLVEMYYEKLKKYFDFLILGDVEAVLPLVLDEYEKGVEDFLKRIEKIEGVYTGRKVSRGMMKGFDNYPIVQPFPKEINKNFVFGKCFMLEIERGCPFDCKFCALKKFYPNVRYRSLNSLKKIIDEGMKVNKVTRVVIYSPSFMHPQRKEILRYLIEKKARVSVPSVRAEQMDLETLKLLKQCGLESLTIAPECNESLRLKLGKNVVNDQYFKFVKMCNDVGINKLKMYIMIGVPGMGKREMDEMCDFLIEMRKRFQGMIYLSVNYFVPKIGTELENYPLEKKKLLLQKKYLMGRLNSFRLKIPSIGSAIAEWKFVNEL